MKTKLFLSDKDFTNIELWLINRTKYKKETFRFFRKLPNNVTIIITGFIITLHVKYLNSFIIPKNNLLF